MNEIPDLKADYAFLKKLDIRHNTSRDIDGKRKNSNKRVIRSNFLLHPKRLTSSSEGSLSNSPRNFFTRTGTKNTSFTERNNNIKENDESNESDDRISDLDSPPLSTRKFYSTTIIKQGLQKSNINNKKKLLHKVTTVSKQDSICFVETAVGDCNNFQNNELFDINKNKCIPTSSSVTTSHKKQPKMRPSSCRLENFDKKLTTLIERSLKIITNIRFMIEKGIPLPDGEEDINRRTKRVQEFSSRFSRIYLYPLVRQMDELSLTEKSSTTVVNQKIICAHQLILQALQAYYNHLPTSVGKCCSDKLQALLEQIVYLCQLYGLIKKEENSENNEFVNALRVHTDSLLETLKNFESKLEVKHRKSTEPTLNKKKFNKPQNNLKSKLSMYGHTTGFRRESEWKKMIETAAKKKFNVKSRYKTANFKHRPPVEKPHIVSLPSKVKLFPKRSSGLRSTPMTSPIKEDEIKTMVEMDNISAPPINNEILNHENSIASKPQQLVRDGDENQDNDVKKALEVLRKFLENPGESEALEKITNEINKKKEKISQVENEKPKKKLKEPVVTIVTGAKNAKLICIRDDNSVSEVDESKQDKEIMTDAEVKLISSETQTDLRNKKEIKSKSAIKISRLPKSSTTLLKLLPKNYAISIIQYKLLYHQFHKHNPMYRKSANIQPWILMGRISDEILDDVIQSVTGELEVNEILENLYNAEFQY